MPSGGHPYPAARLDPGGRQIRILHLLPEDPNEYVISCTLSTANLDDNPQYEALSYVWGSAANPQYTRLNDQPFRITNNLGAALRCLRHATEERILWVDALCINQFDDAEKSQQVNMMGDIYSGTTECLIWLGDRIDGGRCLSDLIEETPTHVAGVGPQSKIQEIPVDYLSLLDTFIGEVRRQSENPMPQEQPFPPRDFLSASDAVILMSLVHCLCSCSHLTDVIREMGASEFERGLLVLYATISCPWCHRIWTLQEAVLPPKATVFSGRTSIPLQLLITAVVALNEHLASHCCPVDDRIAYLSGAIAFTRRLTQVRDLVPFQQELQQQGRTRDLLGLVEFYRNRMSSDPRDMVFGLMSLSSNTSMQAQYKHSLARVYSDLIHSHIMEHKVLSSLLRADEGTRRPGLPTWVPDWSCRVAELDEEMLRFNRTLSPYYNACGSRKLASTFYVNTMTLGLKGMIVDEIRAVGPLHGPYDTDISDTQLIVACKSLCQRKRHKRNRYRGVDKEFEHDFWRLSCLDLHFEPAIGDQAPVLRRATLGDYQGFQSQHPQATYDFEEPWIWRIHRFFVTKKGYIGWAPRSVEVGDKVYVFCGGNCPFVLRPSIVQGPDTVPPGTLMHTFVGHCFAQGLMDGEAMTGVKDEDLELVYII